MGDPSEAGRAGKRALGPNGKPYVGGQAVLEGVMMRGPSSMSIVCRRRSGELVVRERPVSTPKSGPRTWPLLRGMLTLVESLRMGSQALRWSAELYEADLREEEGKKAKGAGLATTLALGVVALLRADPEDPPAAPDPAAKKSGFGYLPLFFALALFVALPQAATEGLCRLLGLELPVNSPAFQALTGACKLVIVVGYLLAIRQVPEIRRVFQYHGAEHKAISTYEADEPLHVEHARPKTTAHPRCGTTFLVMVALVSILVFSAIGSLLPRMPGGRFVENLGLFLMKIPFLPVIAGITFELQRFFARHCTTGPLRALLWPGFLVQKITTAEPDEPQLEVALASLRAALWREEAESAPEAAPDRTFPGYGDLLADPGYARS